MIAIGSRVYLRACRGAGEPGTVVGQIRGRLVVFWKGLSHYGRHRPEALELAQQNESGLRQDSEIDVKAESPRNKGYSP